MKLDVEVRDYRQGQRHGDVELAVASLIETIHTLEDRLVAALDTLESEVAETKTVVQSAIVLIKGIKSALDEAIAAGSVEALTRLSAELDSSTNELAAAISENTPAPKP
jgi:hypothetical protein